MESEQGSAGRGEVLTACLAAPASRAIGLPARVNSRAFAVRTDGLAIGGGKREPMTAYRRGLAYGMVLCVS